MATGATDATWATPPPLRPAAAGVRGTVTPEGGAPITSPGTAPLSGGAGTVPRSGSARMSPSPSNRGMPPAGKGRMCASPAGAGTCVPSLPSVGRIDARGVAAGSMPARTARGIAAPGAGVVAAGRITASPSNVRATRLATAAALGASSTWPGSRGQSVLSPSSRATRASRSKPAALS
ncbi:MAG: hypothetical protein IPP20_07180 [Gemmatimonadetes bacterium]|nr:hypothetical protein [Gemmatimonadota bacterium]